MDRWSCPCSPATHPTSTRVWYNVKAARIGQAGINSHDDLCAKIISALRRLQKMLHIVRGFFGDPKLAHIA